MSTLAIDNARLIVVPAKLVVTIFILLMARKIQKGKDSKLVKMMSAGIALWSLYLILDMVAVSIVAIDPTMNIIANILWRLVYAVLLLHVFLIYNAVALIRKGDTAMDNKKSIVIQVIVILISLGLLCGFYPLVVKSQVTDQIIPWNELPPTEDFYVVENIQWPAMIGAALPMLMEAYALIQLGKLRKGTSDSASRKKMACMIWGIAFLPIGLIYFIIRGIISKGQDDYFMFWTSAFGQVFFIGSVILLYLSLKDTSNQN